MTGVKEGCDVSSRSFGLNSSDIAVRAHKVGGVRAQAGVLHINPPRENVTGAASRGMNTGIGDAVNLGWKLVLL